MLKEDREGNTSDEISCTPTYPVSSVGVPKEKEGDSNKGVLEVAPLLSNGVCGSRENVDQSMIGCPDGAVAVGYKTMWQLCAYCESEANNEFYVGMLSDVLTPKVSEKRLIQYNISILYICCVHVHVHV